MLGNIQCMSVRTNIGLGLGLETSLDEESVDNFMEVEKKGGEERGVVSTVISSINMWNRPRRLVGEEAVVDASTRGSSLSVCHRPRSLLFAKQTVPSCVLR